MLVFVVIDSSFSRGNHSWVRVRLSAPSVICALRPAKMDALYLANQTAPGKPQNQKINGNL